ncbi:MAG: hypothetical protein J0I06_19490 [Planctomycetes bacterium]|nr:hypothetical protein [Planctomycetota bacterium]
MIDPLDRRAGVQLGRPHAPAAPDPAFAARSRLARLRDTLGRAAKNLRPARWNEPAVFFFDRKRQAELDASRSAPVDPFAAPADAIAAEMSALTGAVEVRRVARATDGLAEAARSLAPHCPAARELVELLTVPDDEIFLALAPAERVGVRLHLRGAYDVAQLHHLLAPALGFAESHIQLVAPVALRPDGTLPTGFGTCEHWLWPAQPLAAVPRVGGERVVLVAPAVVRPADAEPRFPGLAVECETVQTLNAFQAADALARLCRGPVPVRAPDADPAVARAA